MKNVTSKINVGRVDSVIDIPYAESKYNAKYVGQLPLRMKDGSWQSDNCADIFYQANPPNNYSNYLAIYKQYGDLYITSGETAASGTFNGIEAADGEIIYSRFRHDYRTSTDGSTFIDGGRDYVRISLVGRHLRLKLVDAEWFELEPGDPDYSLKNL